MNFLSPYAAFIMRLAVGGTFLVHGIAKYQNGISGVGGFLHSIGVPFSSVVAIYLIVVETVGAACVMLGIFTRAWALAMAVNMAMAIVLAKLPSHGNIELEALLLAGSVTLIALGDGPLSIAVRFKKPS